MSDMRWIGACKQVPPHEWSGSYGQQRIVVGSGSSQRTLPALLDDLPGPVLVLASRSVERSGATDRVLAALTGHARSCLVGRTGMPPWPGRNLSLGA
jgi:hypothetical protein